MFSLCRLTLIALAAPVAAALAACGPAVDATSDATDLVAVRPRVVLDGLAELGYATDERIVIDEVLLHAPSVQQERSAAEQQPAANVLQSDPTHGGALVFRYDLHAADGFGGVVDGDRLWQLDGSGDLIFAFAPLQDAAAAALSAATGVSLDALTGHTVAVRGYYAVDRVVAVGGSGPGDDGAGLPTKTALNDPAADGGDGQPAHGDTSDGGDGQPAHPRTLAELVKDGEASDGGDGQPAQPPRGGDAADGGDGQPAHGTGPKSDGGDGQPGRTGSGVWAGATAQPRAITRTVQERIPFTLLVTAPFDLRLAAAALFHSDAADEGVLPIDLHVQLDALLSTERLAALADAAATERAKTDAPVVLEVAGREGAAFFGLAPSAAAVVKHNARDTGAHLRVVGDAR